MQQKWLMMMMMMIMIMMMLHASKYLALLYSFGSSDLSAVSTLVDLVLSLLVTSLYRDTD